MRKFAFLFVVGLFLLSGCGSKGNQVVCTGTQEEDGQKVEMKVVADLKDDKVSAVSATMKLDSEEMAQTLCGFLGLANSMAESDSDKIDYDCDGKEIRIKNFDAMESSEDDKMVGLTKADFIKAMEEEELKCK